MTVRMRRREFLKSTAAGIAGAGFFTSAARAAQSTSPNEKLNLAAVGVANKGADNVAHLRSQNFVALCDIDANYLGKAAGQFPEARKYTDFRKMLDAEQGRIDAVVVSTADHTHAPATAAALELGKHVYCEKPLTHTVAEARAVASLAKRHKLATQMGTQIHAGDNYRRVVEVVQSGAIGTVSAVYNWCNKNWGDGRFRPWDKPVPAHLSWDLWQGPAPERKYSPNLHPGNWRRFWDYGSGTFGDMAAHIMDLPFWALGLRHPTSVQVEGPEVHPVGAPRWTKATYEFPADGGGTLQFHWSDGGAHFDLVQNTKDHAGKLLSGWGLGILFVGDKGILAANYNNYQLLPQDRFAGFEPPEPTIPRSQGHWNEWVHACKTGEATTCNFDYSGALTEAILLGIVAFRCGERLYWDADKLQATNSTKAAEYVNKEYRKGWEVAGLG